MPSSPSGSHPNTTNESIAVIGGGPAAMFYCHAIEMQKKELLEKGEDVSHFPSIRCFERSPGPGGVWRSDRAHEDDDAMLIDPAAQSTTSCEEEKKEDNVNAFPADSVQSPESKRMKLERNSTATKENPNMYSALWTNGPKELFEFQDYTFVDHFGNVEMPTYLPRKYVLEYITARCTKTCPNFFKKYFSFRSSILNVKYLEGHENDSHNNMFRVEIRNDVTGEVEVEFFDKCIWAGGLNGIPNMPKKLVKMLRKGGFEGAVVHSSDTANFKANVEKKRVLIIGGGLSAEDLTLMAIKEGVSHIVCTYRADHKEMSDTSRWPYDKVETYPETTVTNVNGNTITLSEVDWNVREQDYKVEKDGETTVLKNIDTVIFCTGYEPNLNMLDHSLREPWDSDEFETIVVPEDWRMKASQPLEAIMGKDHDHIKPSKYVYRSEMLPSCLPLLYRGSILIKNPKMMYFLLQFSDTPLMETDIAAFMLARYTTGQKSLPSADEMNEDNQRLSLACLDNIAWRYKVDNKFRKAVDKHIDSDWNDEKEDLWDDEMTSTLARTQLLGQIMNEHDYPIRFVQNDGQTLTKLGREYSEIIDADPRWEMANLTYEPSDEKGEYDTNPLLPGWKTFRDASKYDQCVSLFTGVKSCPLPKPWFHLNENDKLW